MANTFHQNLKQSFANFKAKYIGNLPSGVTVAQINTNLTAKANKWVKVGTVNAANTFDLSSYIANKTEVKAVTVDTNMGSYEEFTWTLADVLNNKNNMVQRGYYLSAQYFAHHIAFLTNGTTFKLNIWGSTEGDNINNTVTTLYVR